MAKPSFSCWGFLVDTDSYAGNFEREMCGYLTGAEGDYGSGVDEDEDYSLFEDAVVEVLSEKGSSETTTIYPTEGYSKKEKKHPDYNTVCIFFRDKPTRKQIEFMKEKAKTFKYRSLNKILGFRLVRFKMTEKIYPILHSG